MEANTYFPPTHSQLQREHCIEAGTKRGDIGKAAKRNMVICRDHQAAENYEDSEDYYGVGIFGIVGIGVIGIDYFFLFLILSIVYT